MVSVYGATIGAETWTRLDNVSLRRTSGASVSGTNCFEPGSTTVPILPALFVRPGGPAALRPIGGPDATRAGIGAPTAGRSVPIAQWIDVIDLRDRAGATLLFESWLVVGDARARLQISIDGRSWTPLMEVPPSDDWLTVALDLDAYASRVVFVRFVLEDPGPEVDARTHRWWVREERLR
jgi:hypothetical protein